MAQLHQAFLSSQAYCSANHNNNPSPATLVALESLQNNAPESTPSSPPGLSRKRKQVKKACLNCRRSHSACDSARPCKRCIDSGEEAGCVDVPRKTRVKRKKTDNEESPAQSSSDLHSNDDAHPHHLSSLNNLDFSQFNNHQLIDELLSSSPSAETAVNIVSLTNPSISPTVAPASSRTKKAKKTRAKLQPSAMTSSLVISSSPTLTSPSSSSSSSPLLPATMTTATTQNTKSPAKADDLLNLLHFMTEMKHQHQ